jgi:hypothetical protein
MHPHEVAQFEMDIGYSGYHVLEQLITAMMLEKAVEAGSGSSGAKAAGSRVKDDKALFTEVGHSLISRLLSAGISPPDDVSPVLREASGLEFAIRDPQNGWKRHLLLKNTEALLSSGKGSVCVSLDIEAERSKASVFGLRVLQASISLLSMHASKSGYQVDPGPYFEAIGRLIPETIAATRLAVKSKKGRFQPPMKVTAASSEFPQVDQISQIIADALDKSDDIENALLRKPAIIHNLNRYHYLLCCLSNALKLPLFRFCANQARFVLRTIVEEFLCAAHDSLPHQKASGTVNQKLLAHKLYDLAVALKLPLTPDQINFLQRVPSIRNEARYDGYRVRAPAGASAASAWSFMAAEELEDLPAAAAGGGLEDGFRMVLGSRNEGIRRELEQDLTIVLGLCKKISTHLFPR